MQPIMRAESRPMNCCGHARFRHGFLSAAFLFSALAMAVLITPAVYADSTEQVGMMLSPAPARQRVYDSVEAETAQEDSPALRLTPGPVAPPQPPAMRLAQPNQAPKIVSSVTVTSADRSASLGNSSFSAMTYNDEGTLVPVVSRNQSPLETMSRGNYNALFTMDTNHEANPAVSETERLAHRAIQAYRQKNWAEAEDLLQQALEQDAEAVALRAMLGEVQMQQSRWVEAASTFQKLCEQKPGMVETQYAKALLRLNRREDAMHVLETALLLNPNDGRSAYMLGTLYEEVGDSQRSLPYLKQAAQAMPRSLDALYNLALAYEMTGRPLLAKQSYQKAINVSPGSRDARLGLQRVSRL